MVPECLLWRWQVPTSRRQSLVLKYSSSLYNFLWNCALQFLAHTHREHSTIIITKQSDNTLVTNSQPQVAVGKMVEARQCIFLELLFTWHMTCTFLNITNTGLNPRSASASTALYWPMSGPYVCKSVKYIQELRNDSGTGVDRESFNIIYPSRY